MTLNVSRTYQEEAVRSADNVQLVIMLHDMLIADLRRCMAAIQSRDIESRTNEAAHALSVLEQLQRGLDAEHGAEAAENMDRLYTIARAEILQAQVNTDPSAFAKQMDIFTSLREAWKQTRPTVEATAPSSAQGPESSQPERTWTV